MNLILSIMCALLAVTSAAPTAYQTNLDYINTVRNSGSRWELDVNKFVTLPQQAFSKMFKGYSMTYDPNRVGALPRDSGVPDSFDWRDHGKIVGAVKNQEQCGSCWAFSAVGALESQVTKVTGTPVVLSEQEMVDCVKNVTSPDKSSVCCDGCMGGEMYSVYQYLLENKTEDDTEKQYPYEAMDQDCQAIPNTVKLKLKNFVSLPIGDEQSLKTALYKHGPISVGVNANQDWQLYSKGIYNPSEEACDSSASSMDHGVILVGYGSKGGLDYWIVRNSWGEDWGESGYMRLARGHNACGVGNAAIYPVLASSVGSNLPVLTGDYCGSIMGVVNDIKISFTTNSTLSVTAKVFGKTLSCSDERYSYEPATRVVTLTGTGDCLTSQLRRYGISRIGITYAKAAIKLTVDGQPFSIPACSSTTLDTCHDNCGNSCSAGPCGSCSNLCCGCGCDTCKCCHDEAINRMWEW
jgi:cathepsin L